MDGLFLYIYKKKMITFELHNYSLRKYDENAESDKEENTS